MAGAEEVHRRFAQVSGPLGSGEHERATSLRRHRTVEEVVGVGDHSRRQNVVHGERTAPEVHRVLVHVTVVADRRGNPRQLFGRGSIHMHVASRDEGELRRGEEAVRRDELVGRSRPRRGGTAIGVVARTTRGDHDHVGLPGRDRRCRLGNDLYPDLGPADPRRADAQLVHEVGCSLTAGDPVDLVDRQAGVVEGSEHRFHRQRSRRLPREAQRLFRVVHAHDRDTRERGPRGHGETRWSGTDDPLADDAGLAQAGELRVVDTELGEDLFSVLPKRGRGKPAPVIHTVHPERKRGSLVGSHQRVLHPLEQAAVAKLWVARHVARR